MKPSARRPLALLAALAALLLAAHFRYEVLLRLQKARLRGLLGQEAAVPGEPDIFSDRVPKLWVHRVDSLERFRWLSSEFAGFECDVVYDGAKDVLDVRHPPVPSTGLSFEAFLAEAGAEGKYFWLDAKNLDLERAAPILRLLDRLDARYRIKRRIVVESRQARALRPLAAAGYFTSYYLPAREAAAEPDYIGAARRESFPGLAAVSQEAAEVDLAARGFPEKAKLTWLISYLSSLHGERLAALYGRKDLKVILIGVKSPHFL